MLTYNKVTGSILAKVDDYSLGRWWIEIWSDGKPWSGEAEIILIRSQFGEETYTAVL